MKNLHCHTKGIFTPSESERESKKNIKEHTEKVIENFFSNIKEKYFLFRARVRFPLV